MENTVPCEGNMCIATDTIRTPNDLFVNKQTYLLL